MSYILDALKKSDQERQQNSGPTLQSLHQPARSKNSNPVLWLIACLLAIVIIAAGVAAAWYFTDKKDTGSAATRTQPAPEQVIPSSTPAPAPATVQQKAETTSVVAPAQPVNRPVVAFDELPDPVRTAVPPLTFSFHVYSENPARRTIIINKRRVKEGDLVQGELRLKEITEQGVVLSQGEHPFYINVVEEW